MPNNVVQLKTDPADEKAGQAAKRAILIVEDEVLTRMMLADELRRHGFNVVEAQNAGEAVAVLQSQTPIGLLFTDVQLPGSMDGFGLAQFVRRTRPELKVIITSGNVDVEDRAGLAETFFHKPYALTHVIDLIETLLADAQA
ncbi:MAG TPA: response regulator [Xanthobacteraceae bacterium]|nr:response regulator [Xanthobacteraceae bacterium]